MLLDGSQHLHLPLQFLQLQNPQKQDIILEDIILELAAVALKLLMNMDR
jgi:hypothetical protein